MSVHRETFTKLVKQVGWQRGAELGVDKGLLFAMLLRECPDLYLIGVDTFPNAERSRRAFQLAVEQYQRCSLLQMTTDEASEVVEDKSLDFVFIDADHSEAAVLSDIAHWRGKVKIGGWLGGHDYSKKFPGVVKAVDAVFGKRAMKWPGDIWGLWIKA